MAAIRKPFQGIWNVVRFNWHFYLLSIGFVFGILILNRLFPESYRIFGNIMVAFLVIMTTVSLLVTFYVYDLSGLYKLAWLDEFDTQKNLKIASINAGFDETSVLLADKFSNASLSVFDFYNRSKHTEISIKRAREAYPPFPNTQQIDASAIPIKEADIVCLILVAHEIRNEEERIIFFNKLRKTLNSEGRIVMVEHLRNLPNFLAYNIGAFHFISKKSWYRTFEGSGLVVLREVKITPFISVFTLK